MSTPYQGAPANVTTPLAATINGATNASPIVISTTTAHFYSTGDLVSINGVGGNTAANSTSTTPQWTITVVDATHFSLNGSTGNGAYTSGGTASNQFLTPPFQIPSDGDTFNAAAFNVAYQMLADRAQYLGRQLTLKQVVFTANGNWVVPANCLSAWAIGCGGGGGGAGGGNGSTTTTQALPGGGGGGGAPLSIQPLLSLVPGFSCTVTIGGGGAGGTAGTAGSDGAQTQIVLPNGSTLGFAGGGGAALPITTPYASTEFGINMGGTIRQGVGVKCPSYVLKATALDISPMPTGTPWGVFFHGMPGMGGAGLDINNAGSMGVGVRGSASVQGFNGGAGGTIGTSSGSWQGGGGGGGGGGGPYFGGAAGGNGGNASNSGSGSSGSIGSNAAANSGAGGGGGGTGGFGSSAGGSGATGGNGGSGQLTIIYVAIV